MDTYLPEMEMLDNVGLVKFEENGLFGLKNEDGEIIIQAQYEDIADDFVKHNGMLIAYLPNGEKTRIDLYSYLDDVEDESDFEENLEDDSIDLSNLSDEDKQLYQQLMTNEVKRNINEWAETAIESIKNENLENGQVYSGGIENDIELFNNAWWRTEEMESNWFESDFSDIKEKIIRYATQILKEYENLEDDESDFEENLEDDYEMTPDDFDNDYDDDLIDECIEEVLQECDGTKSKKSKKIKIKRNNKEKEQVTKESVTEEVKPNDQASKNVDYSVFHEKLVNEIKKLKGVNDVREEFENPNKYGDTVSHISFRYNIEDEWNYSKAGIVFNYKNKQLFIPNKGYSILNKLDINEIIKQIISYYKIKIKRNNKEKEPVTEETEITPETQRNALDNFQAWLNAKFPQTAEQMARLNDKDLIGHSEHILSALLKPAKESDPIRFLKLLEINFDEIRKRGLSDTWIKKYIHQDESKNAYVKSLQTTMDDRNKFDSTGYNLNKFKSVTEQTEQSDLFGNDFRPEPSERPREYFIDILVRDYKLSRSTIESIIENLTDGGFDEEKEEMIRTFLSNEDMIQSYISDLESDLKVVDDENDPYHKELVTAISELRRIVASSKGDQRLKKLEDRITESDKFAELRSISDPSKRLRKARQMVFSIDEEDEEELISIIDSAKEELRPGWIADHQKTMGQELTNMGY